MWRNFYLQLWSNRHGSLLGLDLRTGWASNLLGSLSKNIIRSVEGIWQKLWEVTGIHSFFCLFSYCYHSLLWCINWISTCCCFEHIIIFISYIFVDTFWERWSPHDSSSSPKTCGLIPEFLEIFQAFGLDRSRPDHQLLLLSFVWSRRCPERGGGRWWKRGVVKAARASRPSISLGWNTTRIFFETSKRLHLY